MVGTTTLNFLAVPNDLWLSFVFFLAAVFSLAVQREAFAHASRARFVEVALPPLGVCGQKRLGNQDFEGLAEDFFARVAEQLLGLGVDQFDASALADDHNGIRRSLEEPTKVLFSRSAAGVYAGRVRNGCPLDAIDPPWR